MTSQRLKNDLWKEDVDYDDDDNEDFAPLVANEVSSSAATSHRRQTHGNKQQLATGGRPAAVQTQLEMAVFRQQQKGKMEAHGNDDEDNAYYDEYYGSSSSKSSWLSLCWSDTWRMLASSFLALLLIVPFAKRWYRHHQTIHHSDNQQPSGLSPSSSSSTIPSAWPSDDLVCAKSTFQMNFSQLYHQIALSTNDEAESIFCSSSSSGHVSPHPCLCSNPTIPLNVNRGQEDRSLTWNETFNRNLNLVKMAAAALTAQPNDPYDVVLLGDSITERWLGTQFSKNMTRANMTEEYLAIFNELFQATKSKTKTSSAAKASSVKGMALGIAGDRVPQLLYRMQHGELAFPTPPKVWWILIGINDLLSGGCSKETILVGLMRVIHEVQQQQQQRQQRQPSSKDKPWIVMNSILPMGNWKTRRYRDIWASTTWINERLECYVQELDRVVWYNATDLFLIPYSNHTVSEFIVDPMLMFDLLHPSPAGQRLWGEAIVKKVLELTRTSSK